MGGAGGAEAPVADGIGIAMPSMGAGDACCGVTAGVGVGGDGGVTGFIPGISSIAGACAGAEARGAGAGCLTGAWRAGECLVAGAGFAAGLLGGFGAGIGICMPGSMLCAAADNGSDAATATVASRE